MGYGAQELQLDSSVEAMPSLLADMALFSRLRLIIIPSTSCRIHADQIGNTHRDQEEAYQPHSSSPCQIDQHIRWIGYTVN